MHLTDEQGSNGDQKDKVYFDTDSVPLQVDNCSSKCLSPCSTDFIGILTPIHKRIKGIGGYATGIMQGPLKWKIEDDNGLAHDVFIPDAYFVLDAPSQLLSPQHWAQTAKDNHPLPCGTWCTTYDNAVVLQWKQRQFTRMIPLDPNKMNVGTIYTTPGYQ